jgi:hypothetical protein
LPAAWHLAFLSSLYASGFFSIVSGLVRNDVLRLARFGGVLDNHRYGDDDAWAWEGVAMRFRL